MKPNKDMPDAAERAANPLFAEVYARLKAMAGRQLARNARDTLNTTALVHELYLRIGSHQELAFAHEAQFFGYAAKAIRHLLADRARERLSQRAGGDWVRITISGTDAELAIESADQALALDAALQRLQETDARAGEVLELHYFAGLTVEQIGKMLDIAKSTVDRDLRFARAFLKNDLAS